MHKKLADYLWGENASLRLLLLMSVVLLLFMLGGRELWTQEWRWADIALEMLYRHDYLHPYLANHAYYDKPLVSYWLMILSAKLLGSLSEFALRLPSALAGILSVWCSYKLGLHFSNRRVGLLAAWMLLTTYYFIFWARTANADLLNLAGTLLALVWYFDKKYQPSFMNYAMFFLILAVTSLCKGLLGAVIPLLVVSVDVSLEQAWRRHFNRQFILALWLGVIIYLIPFSLSAYLPAPGYTQSGLMQVFRENVLRFVAPFDHKGPLYTYLVYLPIYLIPWTLFFIPALLTLAKRWNDLNAKQRQLYWTLLAIFVFFTLSGSRRNYYTLPMVPFAILITADWILAQGGIFTKRNSLAAWTAGIAYSLFFILFVVLQPIYYSVGGIRDFAAKVHEQAEGIKPWPTWQVILLDARSKVAFYLKPSQPAIFLGIPEAARSSMTPQGLLTHWPLLAAPKANQIFITRQQFAEPIKEYLKNYTVIRMQPYLGQHYLKNQAPDTPVAFIPKDK
jgi:4-amino-4-deoxy-L-arabinose transferase-like glycosyltransferase